MNILYFIGNGFDLNLNMKTSYQDFLNFYKKIHNDSSTIKEFKKEIDENYLDWSDLEVNLGKYTEKLESPACFEEIHTDLIDELANYLTSVQNTSLKSSLQQLDSKKFIKDLFMPESYMDVANSRSLKSYFETQHKSKDVNIVTLNYTNTIESILDLDKGKARHSSVLIDTLSSVTEKRNIQQLLHLHGTLEENMALGVDNVEQVLHKEFKNNQDVTESIIKPLCNRVSAHAIDQDCNRLLANAHLICIFGSSIGKTDETWWKRIADQVKQRDCRLIVFMHEPNLNKRRGQEKRKLARACWKRFSDQELPDNKVFFAFNTEMFNLFKS